MFIKYPRTLHVPWSNWTNDDKVNEAMSSFENKEVIVTEKLDGEPWTIYNNYQHARSVETEYHSYQSVLFSEIAKFAYTIPEGWRICGEYMYAQHTIHYNDLQTYFYVHSIWNEYNRTYPLNVTIALCKVFNLIHVPVIYKGIYNKDIIHTAFEAYTHSIGREIEGYVIKRNEEFEYDDFYKYVAKWVRPNHVQVNEQHWKYSNEPMKFNKLRN